MQLSEKTFDISPSYRPRNENERSRKATEPAKESDCLRSDRPTGRSASSNASAKPVAFHINIKYGKTSSAGSDSLRGKEKARIAGYISPHPVRKQIQSFVPISFRSSPHRHRPTKNDAATNGTSRKKRSSRSRRATALPASSRPHLLMDRRRPPVRIRPCRQEERITNESNAQPENRAVEENLPVSFRKKYGKG